LPALPLQPQQLRGLHREREKNGRGEGRTLAGRTHLAAAAAEGSEEHPQPQLTQLESQPSLSPFSSPSAPLRMRGRGATAELSCRCVKRSHVTTRRGHAATTRSALTEWALTDDGSWRCCQGVPNTKSQIATRSTSPSRKRLTGAHRSPCQLKLIFLLW